MIKSDATFLTFGHLMRAIIVRRLPNMPVIMMRIVKPAAIAVRYRGNLMENLNGHLIRL